LYALLRAVASGSRLAGRVCPARHAGSVDAFLEAFETAAPGDVLVVDNGGLLDEAYAGALRFLKDVNRAKSALALRMPQ
jgi:regulator of RNase E activity RraA